MSKQRKSKSSFLTTKLIPFLIAFLVIMVVYNAVSLMDIGKALGPAIYHVNEVKAPAKISIAVISDASCNLCSDIAPDVNKIKAKNIEIENEAFFDVSSPESQVLVAKYAIEKIPAILVIGEIDKVKLPGFKQVKDVLLFDNVKPPFVLVKNGEQRGAVQITHLKNSDCEDCVSWDGVIANLAKDQLTVAGVEVVEYDSAEGKELIQKYDINKLPTLLFSNDLAEYPDIAGTWAERGSVEPDGMYVLREVGAPYYDFDSGNIKGLVEVTYLVDESCEECYDVAVHKSILGKYGVKINSEKTVDIASSEGKEILEKYEITQVPTIVLSEGVSVYSQLAQIWASVGSVEEDDSYVFRNVANMGGIVFKDLETGELVGQ
ncbi:hypothetical protein HOK51_03575 [Candidatus Woesearchaeota archaeon]|nr:hypothetical protein [Candidatus Woesearchaeota archaeon]MBT6518901.1 hypothetical protein [Candidatus Woesearchaeota archaeon]